MSRSIFCTIGEAQAGSSLLSGEKGIEDVGKDIRPYARSGVLDAHLQEAVAGIVSPHGDNSPR